MNKLPLLLIVIVAIAGALLWWPNVYRNAPSQPQSANIVVSYTDAGFSPRTVNVKSGTTVTFINNSSRLFQPLSIHGLGPGPCLDNTEEGSCKAIAPGGSWSAVFVTDGAWGYYDQLNPNASATIVISGEIHGLPTEGP